MKNTTTFAAMCRQCGLSSAETAEYCGVDNEDTIRKWWSLQTTMNRGTPRAFAWLMIAQLQERVDRVAFDAFEMLRDQIEAGDLSDYHESMWVNFEADDPEDPLPLGAKNAAGARCAAMLIDHFGEEWAEEIFPVKPHPAE